MRNEPRGALLRFTSFLRFLLSALTDGVADRLENSFRMTFIGSCSRLGESAPIYSGGIAEPSLPASGHGVVLHPRTPGWKIFSCRYATDASRASENHFRRTHSA